MIARLQGRLVENSDHGVIVDLHGVGYLVHMPESQRHELPDLGEEITVHVHTHVRETSLELFAFLDTLDRDLFGFLLEASGVGPRVALAVLGNFAGADLLDVIRSGNAAALTSVPGIGRKKAEKILLELRDKCAKRFQHLAPAMERAKVSRGTSAKAGPWRDDLVSALSGLGYRDAEIQRAVRALAAQDSMPDNFQAALKTSLQWLSAGGPSVESRAQE